MASNKKYGDEQGIKDLMTVLVCHAVVSRGTPIDSGFRMNAILDDAMMFADAFIERRREAIEDGYQAKD